MSDEVVLYGNDMYTSPYVFSVFVALEEKGIPYRLETLSLEDRHHERPGYAGSSFTGRIPALRHGDFWIAESSAIDEYVDEAFPPPAYPRLYPEDVRQRARVRMVQAFVRSDVMPVRQERPTSSFFWGEPVRPFTLEGKASAERLVRIADRFLPEGASFITGSFTLADADLAIMLQRLVHNGDPCPPRLADYARAIFARPSVRKWLSRTKWKDR
jgi:glutathione S-transferase